jgi:hypothetical protein
MIPKATLDAAVLDQKIALYMLQDGDPCADLLGGLAGTMQLVLLASGKSSTWSHDREALKAGLNACVSLMLKNKYKTKYTIQIADALEVALRMAPKISSAAITKAWKGMQK